MTVEELENTIRAKDAEIRRLRVWLADIAAMDNYANLHRFINDEYQLCTLDAVNKVAEYARFGLRGAPNIPLSKATVDELWYNDVSFVLKHGDQITFEDKWRPQSKKH